MQLRDYQIDAVNRVERLWGDGKRAVLAVLATGLGKTILTGEVVRRRLDFGRVKFLAHRRELIYQAQDKIQRVTGLRPSIEMGDLRANQYEYGTTQRIVVSTVQTQTAGKHAPRMEGFDPDEFSLLILDEAHRTTSDTYRQVIEYYKRNPKLVILGITATPNRTDRKSLGVNFDATAYEKHEELDVLWGIRNGWLSKIVAHEIYIEGLDLAPVKSKGADFDPQQLAEAMEATKPVRAVVETLLERCRDRTLVFTASVEAARIMTAELNAQDNGSACMVCDATPKSERRSILSAYERDEFRYLLNYGIFTEGYDSPGIRNVAIARPTESELVYRQMLGRGTRVLDGIVDGVQLASERLDRIAASDKPHVTVLDFTGNSGKHKLISALSALAGDLPEAALAKAALHARESGVNVADEIDRIRGESERRAKESEARKHAAAARWAGVFHAVDFKYTAKEIDPFDVFSVGNGLDGHPDCKIPATPAQIAALLKFGVDRAAAFTKRAASLMMDELVHRKQGKLASYNQVKFLRKHGIDAREITSGVASQLFMAIKDNGWRLPASLYHWRNNGVSHARAEHAGPTMPDMGRYADTPEAYGVSHLEYGG